MKRLIQLFDVDWGSSNYDTELRRTELLVRLRWFVALRWIAVVCCLSLAVAAYSRLVPMRFDYRLLAGASLFLALTNLLFGYFNKTIKPDFDHTRQVRYLVIAETSTDYLVLSVASYATGGFEFPILAFFISEIILVSLFCRPAVSLTLTLTSGDLTDALHLRDFLQIPSHHRSLLHGRLYWLYHLELSVLLVFGRGDLPQPPAAGA